MLTFTSYTFLASSSLITHFFYSLVQVIPQDIDWVIKRAAQRGYDTPAAFMSSKPRAGINHKEYGVTSEG